MEGKKSNIIELPKLEQEVLELCLFPEGFDTIVEECTQESKPSIVADAIKNLIHYKLLIAVNENLGLTWVYDSDKMRESTFKATARGVEWMEYSRDVKP